MRTRYDAKSIVIDRSRTYIQSVNDKPEGFWYSVGNDWARWCTDEDFRTQQLANKTEITLDESRMLIVSGVPAFDAFHDKYSVENPLFKGGPRRWHIDWAVVAEEYAGIEIAPYLWKRRLDGDARWYYSWDCASGCVWDLAVICGGEA